MERPDNLSVCMAQKANMEAIFHSVADGLLTVDRDLEITNINRSARAMLGIGAGGATGRHICDILRCPLWDMGELLLQTIRENTCARERENVLVRPDGSEVRVILSTNSLLDEKGEIAGAVVIVRDVTHLRELETRLEDRGSLHRLRGKSYAMQETYALIEQAAPTDSTVLILGESGTGKELIADAIHRCSRRQNAPFIKVNCSALSESLLESELFGHAKGAFTGATHDRKGRFESAQGGTVFLDEIGDLTERIQVKLLRVLQEKEIERVGDTRTIPIDARILAATHQDLKQRVREGRFREDLYYRLNVIPLLVPPLRRRKEDIPELAAHFLADLSAGAEKKIARISPDALRALMDYDWPGNVRELRNAVEHAVVKCRGPVLLLEDLPAEIVRETAGLSAGFGRTAVGDTTGFATPWRAPDREAREIRAALDEASWRRGKAAEILGIDRTTLWRKMKRLGIEPPPSS